MTALDRTDRVDRINRMALRWLLGSVALGAGIAVLTAVMWSFEFAVAAGATSLALGWGFLGSLSWASASSAERIERAVAAATHRRELLAGTAQPTRAALSLVPEGTGHVSPAPRLPANVDEPRTDNL